MDVILEVKDSSGQLHPHSMCILNNGGTESNPDLSVDQVNGSCQHNSTKYISFTAEKVPCGNYSIIVKVDDDRCEPDTIWTKSGHCIWTHDAFGTESDDLSVVAIKNSATMWIIIITLVIIIHVVIGTWFLIRSQSKPAAPVQLELVALRPRNNNINVLLLYPRDCFDFMKTMSSFGRLLERFGNIEVHDCYTADVLNDPLDWLRRVMNFPKLFIVVVASHCGFIQQEAIQSGVMGNSYDIYRNPTFLDCVFPYGLKQIMNDFSPHVYQKIYVIGFRGFSEDDKMLTVPSSLRRYNIPEHLVKLLSEMNLEYTQGGHLSDTAEYISLQNNIIALRNYKLENPDYLGGILNLN